LCEWILIGISLQEKKEENKESGANGEGDLAATKFRFNEETRKTLYNIMQAEGARTSLKNDLR
jgi:hypothetical protein